MTLRMFEHLLQKPDEHILYNLVLRNLEERNYTEYKPPCQEDKDVVENGQIAGAVYVLFVLHPPLRPLSISLKSSAFLEGLPVVTLETNTPYQSWRGINFNILK